MMNFKLLSYCNVVQRDGEITMTLDVHFWLTRCRQEEFSLRNVYVNMLVGTKQLFHVYKNWFNKYQLETPS